jgi:hypothetical protein
MINEQRAIESILRSAYVSICYAPGGLARLVGVRQRKPPSRGFDPRLAQGKNSLACPMSKALWSPA